MMDEMDRESFLAVLKKDIEVLREPDHGYIRAGLPKFSWCFARDTLTIIWQIMDVADEYGPMIEASLGLIARFQGTKSDLLSGEEPGKIFHEWGPNPQDYNLPWQVPYYGSVDSTPLFVFVCGLYYDKTENHEWLEKMWPHIERALEWCERYGRREGSSFLAYKREGLVGLSQQGWKDSDEMNIAPPVRIVEAQGYYYKALVTGAELAVRMGRNGLAHMLKERSVNLKRDFLKDFWSEEHGFFALALGGNGMDMRTTSNPGHLLFTGILDGERGKSDLLVKRLFAPDMWTPFGIRTHSTMNSDFDHMSYHRGSIWPHDNWIIAQGLKMLGYNEEYAAVREALLDAYRRLGKIPELYAATPAGELREIPDACVPQGWATGAMLNFLAGKWDKATLPAADKAVL